MLRPRYRPGWKPSWKAHPKRFPMEFEEWYPADVPVRVSDNSLVVLKQVKNSWNPHEVETLPCDDPPWETVWEVISFVLQVFEGLQFMHELHIIHRDCQARNILYDPRPMYPNMFHPQAKDRARDRRGAAKHYTRTARPVRYHFIDFGLSRRYNPEDVPPREHPILGGNKTVPEFQTWNGEPIDSFPTDIYYVGNMIRTNVLQKYRGVEFLSLIVQDMVQDDPTKRTTIQEVTQLLDALVKSLGRSLEGVFRDISHTFRTARYIFARKSAIPLPD
ncbi:hypothetical protein BV20DRAFT_1045088 [Pilatotrama ljubarskyi]|nr:hypothetical protein BV20DRAFT_1045088 [Pilatotrama ljubarskyi]